LDSDEGLRGLDLGGGVIALFSVITVALVAMTRAGSLQIAIPSKSQGPRMIRTTPEQNKTLVIEAFDTLFNKRDYDAASRFWSDKYIQHSAHIEPGREGLFGLVRSLPDSLRYEHGLILAEGDYVIVHGRFSGHGGARGVGGRRRGEDRERRAGRALGRTPGRGDESPIEERIAHVRRPLPA
jgi:hypothetical protein